MSEAADMYFDRPEQEFQHVLDGELYLYVAAMLLGIDDPDGKTFSIFERDIDEDLKLLDMGERIQAR